MIQPVWKAYTQGLAHDSTLRQNDGMLSLYVYDIQTHQYVESPSIEALPQYLSNENLVLWLDLFAPTDDEQAVLSKVFKFDEFAIEDCVHPRQLPKLESFEDYHFFIVQGAFLSADNKCTIIELDGFLGDRFLVTHHSEPVQAIDNAKLHITSRNSSRLKKGTAYLCYEILDQLIDTFLPILDYFDETMESIEAAIADGKNATEKEYLGLSSQILGLRRIAVKNQQVFYQFSHSSLPFIDAEEARLFRDIYDHAVRVVDTAEYHHQALHGVLDVQFSMSSNRMNQVVQFLTVFATIMLPLNVVTGIYGMNLDWMPFLHNHYGFWIITGFMVLLETVLLITFRRRGWL